MYGIEPSLVQNHLSMPVLLAIKFRYTITLYSYSHFTFYIKLCLLYSCKARGGSKKFADASKVLYGEQLKYQTENGSSSMPAGQHQFVIQSPPLANGVVGGSHVASGTMSSLGSRREHRMSLNINPLNELDDSYGNQVSEVLL